ncbi:DUF4421 family protein [Brumimicrobium aurantiacum]|uniref:DUF4421 domain-containing protein n=1 Tax=Brumimicrobium aurantiacum TaxID=1737063 RepID=A0A3E1EZD5_9FLAO|nr:DUF4421 family protein [Brumimicrobium aurantiacum]RFC54932.1 DUF4421 domain-containing protein [Brumimicrobium aurantiacum]
MKVLFFFFLNILLLGTLKAQDKALPYVMYPNNLVGYTSLTINGAPIKLSDDFGGFNQLKLKPNLNLIQGIGIAYKWLTLNISYKLPGHIKDVEDYGKTSYFNLGAQFSYKRWDFGVSFQEFKGFGIKDALMISNQLPVTEEGYYLNSSLRSRAFGVNAYYFNNPDMRMKPAVGIIGRYTDLVHGAYLRLTTNIHSLSSSNGIIPHQYLNTAASIHRANTISAFDFGAVPGYGFVNNIDGWQFGAFAGVGAVIQAKRYKFDNTSRGFLGLAPRVDLKLQFGYNVDQWFMMLTSTFDQKNIKYSSYKYNQTYYNFSVTYGYRFSGNKMKKLFDKQKEN